MNIYIISIYMNVLNSIFVEYGVTKNNLKLIFNYVTSLS